MKIRLISINNLGCLAFNEELPIVFLLKNISISYNRISGEFFLVGNNF